MKVYIALRGYDYEGETIIGVFSNKNLAEAKNKEDEYGRYHSVEEFEVTEK